MVQASNHPVTRWLQQAHPVWLTIYASFTAFCLYSCVYIFRKTFSVATFQELNYWGISYKVWLVTFQVLGYATSKFIGIKVVSEIQHHKRARGILLLVGIAGLSWLFFAIVPAPYNLIFLLTNGLPLGMIWGIIFSYLEGRRMTEVLGTALSISFTFSSGFCRTTGAYILYYWHVSELWMPFVASAMFIIPTCIFIYLIDKIPPPSPQDVAHRSRRKPMNKNDRRNFLKSFLPGIALFVLSYMLLTAFRDFRDNFSAELWASLGYAGSPTIFIQTEIIISLVVGVVMASIIFVKNNNLALTINHLIILSGFALLGVSTFLFQFHNLHPFTWMLLVGLGLYLGYIPFNSIFFERLLAAFRYVGTVGFIMYVSDAFGYAASVAVLFFKEFAMPQPSWLDFMISGSYAIAGIGSVLTTGSLFYFLQKQYAMANQKRLLTAG